MALFKYIVLSVCLCGIHLNGFALKNQSGEEFMQKYDPRLSLAPRDIVARAIDNEMKPFYQGKA